MTTILAALLFVFAALFAVGGAWLVYKAVTSKTTRLWRATGLCGGLALLCLVTSGALTFASGCGKESCDTSWFADAMRTVGLIAFVTAVVLLFASAVDQYARTWRRS
jgi:hypothetical protein